MTDIDEFELEAYGLARLTGSQLAAGATSPVAATETGSVVLPDGTEMLRVASESIGFGVTPSAWGGSGNKALDVGTFSAFAQEASTGGAVVASNAYKSDDTTWRYKNTNVAGYYSVSTNGHQWYTAPSGATGNPISFTRAMALGADARLKLTGSVSDAWAGSSSDGLQLSGGTLSGVSTITTYLDDSAIRIGSGVTQKTGILITGQTHAVGSTVQFSTGGTERARIDSSGNLLVGATGAVEKLTISGRAFLANQPAPPTPTGGGVIYVEDGALKYKGSSGTVTTLAPA